MTKVGAQQRPFYFNIDSQLSSWQNPLVVPPGDRSLFVSFLFRVSYRKRFRCLLMIFL